jgi:hypothetical protein
MNPTAPSAPVIRKVTLGGLKKKEEAKPAGKSYPQIPDSDGTISKLAADIRREKEQYEALEGSIKAKGQELKSRVVPFFYATNAGRQEIPSSVRCAIRKRHDLPEDPAEHDAYEAKMEKDPTADQETGAILVTFVNKYPPADESTVEQAIGEANAALYFRQKFALEIDGDKIPADQAGELIQELQTLFTKYGCPDALSASEKIVPVETFHKVRHTALSKEQNAALEMFLPAQTQLKTKNIK